MTTRKRSKRLNRTADSARGQLSQSVIGVSPLILPTAPDGLACAGEHGVAGEPGRCPAYPYAIGDTTEVTSTSPSELDLNASKHVSPGERLQVERRTSIEHERYVAHSLRGRTTPASGALGIVGDVRAHSFVVSCKRTGRKTFDLVTVIEQACRYGDQEDLTPAVALRLEALAAGVEKDWVAIPLRSLSALMSRGTK